MSAHIVWDWNGTLFDDFQISVEAASLACQLLGGAPIDGATYRRCFRRPVRTFYEHLLERELDDAHWQQLAQRYHELYRGKINEARLRPEARDVLADVSRRGVSQSLLSMSDHVELIDYVQRNGLSDLFLMVHGAASHERTESKRNALERHIRAIQKHSGRELSHDRIIVIGDALDDAHAAAALGVHCVLLADGCYERLHVERMQVDVAPCLRSAASAGLEFISQAACKRAAPVLDHSPERYAAEGS